MSFFEKFKINKAPQENLRSQKQDRLRALEQRLNDLNAWQNHWIPEDRVLADNRPVAI